MLTRLNGCRFALNPDLIERAEQTPDTVITLVDGVRYLVAESLPEVIANIQRERASVLAMTELIADDSTRAPSRQAIREDSEVIPIRRNK